MPAPIDVSSIAPLTYCPGEEIIISGSNFTNFPEYKYFIGDHEIVISSRYAIRNESINLPTEAGIEPGHLRILDALNNEVFRSAEMLTRKDYCAKDFKIAINGIHCKVLKTSFFVDNPDSTIKTEQKFLRIQENFEPIYYEPGGLKNSSVTRDGNTLTIEMDTWEPTSSTSQRHTYSLQLTFEPGTENVRKVDYYHFNTYDFGTPGKNGGNSREIRIQFDVPQLQGNQFVIKGPQLLNALTLQYVGRNERKTLGQRATASTSTLIPGSCELDDSSELRIQLGRQ